jgi:hypothetical protein
MTAGAARPGGDNRSEDTVRRDVGVGSMSDDAWGIRPLIAPDYAFPLVGKRLTVFGEA